MGRLKRIFRHLAMLFCCMAMSAPQATLAEGTRILELADGSIISGQIISFENGVYTVASPALGRLKLKDSKIRSIRFNPGSTRLMQSSQQTPNTGNSAGNLADIEGRIMADPEIISMVMSLQQDPEIQAILTDSAIMQAIAARDMESLRNNPKIRQFEGNATIRKILGRLNR